MLELPCTWREAVAITLSPSSLEKSLHLSPSMSCHTRNSQSVHGLRPFLLHANMREPVVVEGCTVSTVGLEDL